MCHLQDLVCNNMSYAICSIHYIYMYISYRMIRIWVYTCWLSQKMGWTFKLPSSLAHPGNTSKQCSSAFAAPLKFQRISRGSDICGPHPKSCEKSMITGLFRPSKSTWITRNNMARKGFFSKSREGSQMLTHCTQWKRCPSCVLLETCDELTWRANRKNWTDNLWAHSWVGWGPLSFPSLRLLDSSTTETVPWSKGTPDFPHLQMASNH